VAQLVERHLAKVQVAGSNPVSRSNQTPDVTKLSQPGFCYIQRCYMNGQQRKDIRPGLRVAIVQKADQRTGRKTLGVVKDILTSAAFHPHGIKVRLESGAVGRVQEIEPETLSA
jgi:uncharacterized repeat protein (TIGR03833 family)